MPIALLQTVVDCPELPLRHLRVLQHAEILYEKQAFPEAVYTFKHALTQRLSTAASSRNNAGLCMPGLSSVSKPSTPTDASTRSTGWRIMACRAQCGKAVAYRRQVGTKAMTQSAYHEAAIFEQVRRAAQYLPEGHDTHVQAIDLRLDLRSAIYPLGELGRILVYPGSRPSPRPWATNTAGVGLGFLTTHYTQIGEPDHALTCGQRTRRLLRTWRDVGLTVMAQHNLGQVYRNPGDYRRAVAC